MSLNLPNVTLVCVEDTNEDDVKLAGEIVSGIKKQINFYDIKLLSSFNLSSVTDRIEPINSLEEYSIFVLNELIKYTESEFVMIMQKDGYPLLPSSWSEEFLKYDYIGAPWTRALTSKGVSIPVPPFSQYHKLYAEGSVGNGGFSLRSRKLMEEVASRKYNCTPIHNYLENDEGWIFSEDEYICRYLRSDLESKGFKFAPVEIAQCFSVENDAWVGQFGFHGNRTLEINKAMGRLKFDSHLYEERSI